MTGIRSGVMVGGKTPPAIAGKLSWTDSRLEQAMSAYKSLFSNGVIENGATAVAQ